MNPSCTCDDTLATLASLEPASQADLLTQLAQQARLVHMGLEAVCGEAQESATRVARRFERALEEAMDAEAQDDATRARDQLTHALSAARNAGLRLSASVGEMELDGVLGMQRLPVLTAVLSGSRPQRQAARVG